MTELSDQEWDRVEAEAHRAYYAHWMRSLSEEEADKIKERLWRSIWSEDEAVER